MRGVSQGHTPNGRASGNEWPLREGKKMVFSRDKPPDYT